MIIFSFVRSFPFNFSVDLQFLQFLDTFALKKFLDREIFLKIMVKLKLSIIIKVTGLRLFSSFLFFSTQI